VTDTARSNGCVFCDAQQNEQSSLIVFHGRTCFVILNLYPYNNGHLMVIPTRHVASLAEATPEELGELIELTRLSEMALREAYSPHMHIVPRWNGDTNFRTIVGETRVLPEELPSSAAKLRPIFEKLASIERV
jgi:ATP adenylyltransferase